MLMESSLLERFLKSFWFSLFLFVVWGAVTLRRGSSLVSRFDWMECGWVVYNGSISILFLIRERPTVVSLKPSHWLVALVTSFSGFLFKRYSEEIGAATASVANGLIIAGLAWGTWAAIGLRRSYDFLPALRAVRTESAYRFMRHPMYLSSVMIRLGYIVRHFSLYNLAAMLVIVWLYDRRAAYEEEIMKSDSAYRDYTSRVRFKFLPKVY